MEKIVKHPTYQSSSYVTIKDVQDAMKQKPCAASDKEKSSNPDLTRVITYFENKFLDIDKESPEFGDTMRRDNLPRRREQKAQVKDTRYQTMIIVEKNDDGVELANVKEQGKVQVQESRRFDRETSALPDATTRNKTSIEAGDEQTFHYVFTS